MSQVNAKGNYVQEGEYLQIDIPEGGCSRTMPLQIGNGLVGIPQNDCAAGVTGEVTVAIEGAFRLLPLKAGDTPAVGDKLYWDNNNNYFTTTASGNLLAGYLYEPLPGDDTCTVRLIYG